jgi:hypothetical protein
MDDRAPQPDEIEIDYIQEDVRFDTTNPHYAAFQQVFEAFKISEPDKDGSQQMETEEKAKEKGGKSDSSDDEGFVSS